jgi:hypothetical protein
MGNVKAGIKTSEFFLTFCTDLALIATAAQGSLPTKWATIAGVVANGSYAISRAIAKNGAS